MKKYLSFIVFFALLEICTSLFISSKFGTDFLDNPDNHFTYLDYEYEVGFNDDLYGRLYYSDTRPTLLILDPPWRQMVNVYYCESEVCILSKKYVRSDKIEETAIKKEDYDETGGVTLKTYTYYDVFGKYDLSYSGWTTRYVEHKFKKDSYYDVIFVPKKDDELNSCVWLTSTKRKWYTVKNVDITKSKWYKKNVGGIKGWDFSKKDEYQSVWDKPEVIEFDAEADDIFRLQLLVSSNSNLSFFLDGISIEPSSVTNTISKNVDVYNNYEFIIDKSGKHYLTIVHFVKDQDLDKLRKIDENLLPYVYINGAEVRTHINDGRNLDNTNLKDTQDIAEVFQCVNGIVEDRKMKYNVENNK